MLRDVLKVRLDLGAGDGVIAGPSLHVFERETLAHQSDCIVPDLMNFIGSVKFRGANPVGADKKIHLNLRVIKDNPRVSHELPGESTDCDPLPMSAPRPALSAASVSGSATWETDMQFRVPLR